MATIKDIADTVGVSIGTVDRILHKRGRFSKETALKVEKAMKDLNYTPNIHARGLKKTRKYIFCAVIPQVHQDSGYWQLILEGLEQAGEELASFGSVVKVFHFDRYSSASYRNAVGQALSGNVDGLLLAPVRSEDSKELLCDIPVPYLFIDSDVPELSGKLSYIGQDSRQSGILSGRLMSLLLGDARAGSVVIIEPPGENYHLRSRIAGFREYMEEHKPTIHLQVLKESVDDEEVFHKFLEKWFRDLPENGLPNGIFAANSSVYYAASFLKQAGGQLAEIPLIGYDIIPGRESVIDTGIIDFIITQQPELQGQQGLMMLYEHLVLGKDVPEKRITPLNIITRENLHTFERNRSQK